jgi:hypothetical protein
MNTQLKYSSNKHLNKYKMIYKWLVTFTTPASKGKFLKETVEATDWFHAKALLESRYVGIKILNYTSVR